MIKIPNFQSRGSLISFAKNPGFQGFGRVFSIYGISQENPGDFLKILRKTHNIFQKSPTPWVERFSSPAHGKTHMNKSNSNSSGPKRTRLVVKVMILSLSGTQKVLLLDYILHEMLTQNMWKPRWGTRHTRSKKPREQEGRDGWRDIVPTKNGILSLPERVRLLVRPAKRCCVHTRGGQE